MHLYNSLSRTVEPFAPLDPTRVTMYVCGPTVYNYVHIGNGRGPVVFDVLASALRRRFGQVIYARNITDVDDKINQAANEQQVPISAITDRFTNAYLQDMAALGVRRPDIEPTATGHISHIIAMIEQLIESGHAYAEQGHVLFSVESFAEYGRLSGRNPDELLAGARVDIAPYKRNPGDFVLWKPSDATQPGWESPWSVGRPGWHIECSAMAAAHLGETIDIHAGGIDLQFPHHENEIAQSVCAHGGKPFARWWLHNGMLNFGGAKMSKSLGNGIDPMDWVRDYGADALRFALARGANPGVDLPIGDDNATAARNFATKLWNASRFAQVGSWSGTLSVDGRDFAVDPDVWLGTRDRSWGIRPSGESDPAGRWAAEPREGFWWTYVPLRFDDYAADARAWAAEAASRAGKPCAWLIGHSEGALIATLAVAFRSAAKQIAGSRSGYGMLMLRGIEVGAAVVVLCFGVLLLLGYLAVERGACF